MPRPSPPDLVISGLGVTASVGQGQAAFADALSQGAHAFGVMQRPGRQRPGDEAAASGTVAGFLGAELPALAMPARVPAALRRTASLSAQAALATLDEAWQDAGLDEVDPTRIGLVIGGSNVQQRELVEAHRAHRGRESFVRPTYGMAFMDSDLCGLCSETFGIRGMAFTVGGASASGQVAVIRAAEAVSSGEVDVCIALGALMDLSYWECQGFRSLGAMGSDRFAASPEAACRPFDRDRDGFIFGEACGAVVVERAGARIAAVPRARLAGWSMTLDGNRNPNPSVEGEAGAIAAALAHAGLRARDVDYVNPHGTGSGVGDTTELEALRRSGLEAVRLNTTKSLLGHGLSAAGIVELIAVLVQMKGGWLHPSRNLEAPIEPAFGWVGRSTEAHRIQCALNLSMGFGGVNTAVCLRRC